MQESIKFIDRKINILNDKIERNIEDSINDRGHMSQNIIKSFRDLVEHISFKFTLLKRKRIMLNIIMKILGKR